MKLKFRKNKPPIKLLEKNELKHLATVKMKKAGRAVIEQETPSRQASCPIIEKPEEKATEWLPFGVFGPIAVQRPALCPLCKKPLGENNRDTVVLNGKRYFVHKTCPPGLKIKPSKRKTRVTKG